MSVPLVGVAGWFTRAGAFIGEYNRVAAMYGSDLDDGFQSIWSQFGSSDQAAVQNLPDAVTAFRNSASGYLQTLAADGLLAGLLQVNDDVDVIPYNYTQALTLLTAQMRLATETVNRPTLTATVTPWVDNLGNATVAVGMVNIYGDPLDTIYAETVRANCITAGTNFTEGLQAVGEAAVAFSSPNWPAGSGSTRSFTITNPAGTSLVTDGGFENWTGTGDNTPVSWTIINGDAGVTISRGSGGVRGNYTAVITSDGSQATQLGQAITLAVNTVYCVSVQAKVSATDGSGIFRMAITDQDGVVLTDDAGNALSYTRNMSAQITTSFQCFTAFFSTPRQLPTTTRVQYGFSTAPSIGKTCTLDLAATVAAVQLYNQGPYIAGFSADLPNAVGDYYNIAFTNSLGSQSFVRGAQRVFNLPNLGATAYFPSATSETIPDSLVTH